MSILTEVKISNKRLDTETLHVNSRTRKVKAAISVVKYRDKDTRQIVLYTPALDISGYGNTEEKAREMLRFSIAELFKLLTSISPKEIEIELASLGWKHNPFKNKEFSKAFVDGDGELQNLNAVGDTIERLTLTAV